MPALYHGLLLTRITKKKVASKNAKEARRKYLTTKRLSKSKGHSNTRGAIRMFVKKQRAAVMILVLMTCWLLAQAQTTPTLPPVRVTAPRIGGGNIVCRGEACEGVIQALRQEKIDYMIRMGQVPMDPEDIALSKSQVCSRLKAKQPANCNYSSPPSTPGYDPAWQPNGCGVGPRSNWFFDKVLNSSLFSNYSGDLDSPAGVSFLSACNRHDQCWGQGMERTYCDLSFEDGMKQACEVLTDPNAFGTCRGFASAYHAAVSPTNSQSTAAYNNAVSALNCAAWAHDMKANGCPQ